MDSVEKLYADLLNSGVSIRNVRYVHSLLHKSLKDAVKRGHVAFNAADGARQPRLPQKEMEILDEYQALELLIAAKSSRHEALLHLAIKTGMRQGELLGLKWSDLDWNRGTIRVERQVQRVRGKGMQFMPPKTKAGRRTIQIFENTLLVLRSHKSQQEIDKMLAGPNWKDHDLIIASKVGTPLSQSNLLKEFKSLLNNAGIKRIRFHDLRHTAASIMLNHGVPTLIVSKILGHSKPSTTLDMYGHLLPLMQEEAAKTMDELLTPIPVQTEEEAELMSITTSSNVD